jgi:adenosine deaminase
MAHDHELRMLEGAQRWLRAQLGRLEITVESNPSSNLLIGALPTVEEHPVFRLQHLRGTRLGSEPPVQVSVNVDNPLTFSSRLADEFAHLYFALLRKNVAAADALAWLDEAREHGWRSRFTVPASADRDALESLLKRE